MLSRKAWLAAMVVVGAGLGVTTASSHAADLGKPGELFTLEVHGFVSQGFLWSTANNYLTYSSSGSFDFSEVGINFTIPVADRLRLGVQLFAAKIGPIGDYTPSLDWYYLDYHWQDWLGVRAGRVKIPFGLYNDIADIDAARPTILLPSSTYPISGREFLLAQTGVEVYGILPLDEGGALDYNFYAGTLFLDADELDSPGATASNVRVPYVTGGRLMWRTPLEGLRVGGSVLAGEIDGQYVTSLLPSPVNLTLKGLLWVTSLEYSANDLLLAAEYGRWRTDVSSDSALLPESISTSERGYAMAAYRVDPAWQLSIYYALEFPDVSDRHGNAQQQHDVAVTVRYDVNPYWLFKVEVHAEHGTAELDPVLNNGTARDQLEPNWGLLMLKTTATF